MEKTTYKPLNRDTTNKKEQLPVKVLQFGEGNFLRAFVDFLIDKMNKQANFNAGVVVVQPIERGLIDVLNKQDGLYHLFMQGVKNGKEVQENGLISCIQHAVNPYNDYNEYLQLAENEELAFILSNTTEAGIAFDEKDELNKTPHNSFPAKLTALLYHRFKHFNGSAESGLTVIPCELINYNADKLKEIILQYTKLWNLEDEFVSWLNESNSFHNSLVDRIVPGYPGNKIESFLEEIEFEDKLVVNAEKFLLWVIEGGEVLTRKIPFNSIEENIKVVDNLQPYRTRKVRILNGAHTSMVPFSLLYGNKTVKETVDDEFTGTFVRQAVFKEIIPTLSLDKEELEQFAEDVLERFTNPFIKHKLADIALNSVSKFKVRVLPSLLAYQKEKNKLPKRLTFAFACLLRFYQGTWKGEKTPLNDSAGVIDTIQSYWKESTKEKTVKKFLSNKNYWEQDLTTIDGLVESMTTALELIEENGIREGFQLFYNKNE